MDSVFFTAVASLEMPPERYDHWDLLFSREHHRRKNGTDATMAL
jgi:hypothetical protein